MGSVAFAAGCNAHPERHLYTLVRAPEDMVTGEPTWYATTCRECPAGCGVIAKNREGRVIKLEGNPLHPVNRGKLCARGQAALQGVYHPDRLLVPRLKVEGRWKEIPFDQAADLIHRRAALAGSRGEGRVALVSEVVGESLLARFSDTLRPWRALPPVIFEPLAYEGLKSAWAQTVGQPVLPGYRLEQADFILGFGADFLETWLSPVEYGRRFKAMHALADGRKGCFVHVGPYQSLTAANADLWRMCRPGGEAVVALGLIQGLLNRGAGQALPVPFRAALNDVSARYRPAEVARQADVSEEDFQGLLHRLQAAKRPLVLPTAAAGQGNASATADLATVLLNVLLDPTLARLDFSKRHRVEIAHSRSEVQAFWQQLAKGPLEVLLLNHVNPLYSLPADGAMAEAMARKDLFKVAFTRSLDETAAAADLIVPVAHPLESWDVYESKSGLPATLQPVLGQIDAAPGIGDFFGALGEVPSGQPAGDYRAYLQRRLAARYGLGSEYDWLRTIQDGGRFESGESSVAPPLRLDGAPVKALADLLAQSRSATQRKAVLQVSASLRFYDGRNADHPWLAELPDAITQVAWQTVAMVHPDTMAANGWHDGQPMSVATARGQVAVPAYGYPGLHPELLVIPMGQGHTCMGRYARQQGINPIVLLEAAVDARTGQPDYTAEITGLASAGNPVALASVSGSRSQHHRRIALETTLGTPVAAKQEGLTINDFPLTLPLPEGYAPQRDIYPPHDHVQYRWGMAVDLDRCIGCEACVAGCYAENNVGVVGEKQIVKGREMAWIRIERYQHPEDPARLIFLPMLCQHCDNAPCESVCPVYAPHHSKEGLNNQVYNRCIGTRFCAQNCPYKVRRFNWFDWQWPAPLNMQLNPDVTVRSKGVMEKCSFCVQRIKAAHNRAKNEQRTIRDGEVTPACVQTCPTDALIFGNLMDPESVVRKKIDDPRAYQVLGYLNTKPAVIYLKKVVQQA